MYAKLKVTVQPVVNDPAKVVEHAAWKVETIRRTGEIIVHLDGNDGYGSYAEPAGEIVYPRGTPITVDPDF